MERAIPADPQVYSAPIWKCGFDVQLLPQSERRIRHDLVRHCVLLGADSLLRAECWRLQVLHDRSKQAMGILRSSTITCLVRRQRDTQQLSVTGIMESVAVTTVHKTAFSSAQDICNAAAKST